MENPEEILHSLEEFSKLKPKDIPRELEEYLCFVAKTGDPVYQWGTIKSLFKEKLINVITDFYESCPSVDIPPCPNVEVFNYESMKSFILEKLDTFVAAPFTVQRICELLTTPRKEYNRIDKYMRALEKNILVVSTTEPGNRRTAENGEGIVNGLESEHLSETNNSNDINVEEMDDSPVWSRITPESVTTYQNTESNLNVEILTTQTTDTVHTTFTSELRTTTSSCSSSSGIDSVITCRTTEEQPYVSIEPVASDSCLREENVQESDVTVTITAIPASVQKRRDSIEPVVSTEQNETTEQPVEELVTSKLKEAATEISEISTSEEVEVSSHNEAETSSTEDKTEIIVVAQENKFEQSEATENVEREQLEEQSSSLIQIPIISDIPATQSDKEDAESSQENPILALENEESVSSEESNLEQPKTDDSEASTTSETSEISSSSSTSESLESHSHGGIICENSTTVVKETVSSSDEIPSDRIKNYEEISQENILTDCSVDTNLNVTSAKDDDEKESNEIPLSSIQEFASSSTSEDPMELDIDEESRQEPPTSHG